MLKAVKRRADYIPALNSYFITGYGKEVTDVIKKSRYSHLGGDKYLGHGVWEVSEELWQRLKVFPHTLEDRSVPKPVPLVLPVREDDPLGKYHYQEVAAELLKDRASALLFFDTGTGKTRTALLALSKLRKNMSAVIVVGESALVTTWKNQCEEFFPELSERVVPLYAGVPILERVVGIRSAPKGTIFIINIQAMRDERIIRALDLHDIAVTILDECQCIIGLDTQQTAGMNALRSAYRWALSATPIKNSPLEWHSLLGWLGVVRTEGAKTRFKEYYAYTTIDKWGGYCYDTFRHEEDLEDLKNLVAIRVTKEGLGLPPRDIKEVLVKSDKDMRSILDDIAIEKQRDWIDADFKVAGQDFHADNFSKLFYIERVATAVAREKVEFILSQKGEQMIVVSCLKAPLIYLNALMPDDSVLYHGDLSVAEREQNLSDFMSGKKRVLLMTQKSGGVGLTLTNSHIMVFLDAPSNEADFNQCADRVHRIGQTMPVTIYILKAKNSCDIYAWEHLGEKQSWIDRYYKVAYEGGREDEI